MKLELIDVTRENWMNVVFLTTNKDSIVTLCEDFVASNALSIVQSVYEDGWTIKAIKVEDGIVGFTMYGYCEEHNLYEISRLMIDTEFQGYGYGKEALKQVIEEMKKDSNCKEVYASADSNNSRAKSLFEALNFTNTNKCVDYEELYCLDLLKE